MELTGFELRNFRSIGSDPVILSPWRKCNILIGQNNSGKSNVIRAIKRISDNFRAEGRLTDHDLHRRSPENDFQFRLCFESSSDEELVSLVGTTSFYFDFVWQAEQRTPKITDHSIAHVQDFRRANELFSSFGGRHWTRRVSVDDIHKQFVKLGNNFFNRFSQTILPVHIIPEFRQIQSGDEYLLGGANLIGLLASYQHPADGKDQDREKFDRIKQFVQRLLHLPEAVLEVTHDKTTIMLKSNGLRLPLASYGTGVHELVILVTAVLSVEGAICCIEEPEIHLHPRLQREFIGFITTETTNQYLISTHSPTFIDVMNTYDDVQVFHLRLEKGATVGGPILKDRDGLFALHDLGVRAGDILQSNCILWVEGPSDRVYVKRWLELAASDLVEGRDYSIMFYAGSLRSHLCIDRDKVPDDLIHLLRINQNAVVIMDSDRERAGTHLNKTKLRVRAECERSGCICWVTDGREIENYLPERVLVTACEELTGKRVEFSMGQYDKFEQVLSQALGAAQAKNLNYAANKVRYARKFVQHFGPEDMEKQLGKHIEQIVAKIRFWNE